MADRCLSPRRTKALCWALTWLPSFALLGSVTADEPWRNWQPDAVVGERPYVPIRAAPTTHDCCPSDHDALYAWRLFPHGVIYRSYLAGAKEPRFRSVWNEDQHLGSIWDITLGGRAAILRYGTGGDARPMGWELGIEGAGLVRLDRDENADVDATDYRFGIPLAYGDDVFQAKFAYYHLSSHVGDEFLLKNPSFARLNYSRDVLVLGASLYPFRDLRTYCEVGYAFYADVAKQWEMQAGIDYSPEVATGARGAPFFALNGALREELNYGGNWVVQLGWAWRGSPSSGLFRAGVEYYNGKSDQFSFFNSFENKVGFALWYDF